MSFTITTANEAGWEEWDRWLSRSPHASPFHQRAALELLADHTETTLYPLLAYKGDHAVGLLPVFEGQIGPFTTVVSPPKQTEVYYLGPVLCDIGSLKQRKLDQRTRRFSENSISWIRETIDPSLIHIRTVDRFHDLRPFSDANFNVTPYYTYITDLTPAVDELMSSLSRDARSNVTNADTTSLTIQTGGKDAARSIIQRVSDRYEEQNKSYHIDQAFIDRLITTLPEGSVRPYICSDEDGTIIGGIITLEYGDTIYRWQGGTKPDVGVPVNDLLDWHVMCDAKERGLKRYDLVGANTERICRYKSKFAPELVHYHGALWRTPTADLASSIRSFIRSSG